MDIKIDKIIYPGKSISRQEGKVIITDEGLAQETVEIEVIKERKNYTEAKTKTVKLSSVHRIEPRCAHYRICSPYQYIDYKEQVRIKEAQIRETFSHDLKIEKPNIIFNPSPVIWGYRNKISLRVVRKGGLYSFAYVSFEEDTSPSAVKECFLAPEETNSAMDFLIDVMQKNSLDFIEEVTIRQNSKKEVLLALYGKLKEENKEQLLDISKDNTPGFIKGIVYIIKESGEKFSVWGDSFLTESINGKVFHVGAESFFQVNLSMLEKLASDLENSLSPDTKHEILDLYCGVGTFGILLAHKAKRMTGVESQRENVYFLKKNILLNNIPNFAVNKNPCEKAINELLQKRPHLVIMDPPRKGLSDIIINSILEKPAPALCYISCNPATLARDLKKLLRAYNLKSISCYDFFPHTPHIETVVILRLSIS
ncbi:MAG: 23S rRNA (uracil(1939)-C(5))-methyltransferase RlmD [Candidatus Omnitrophota bacterium]